MLNSSGDEQEHESDQPSLAGNYQPGRADDACPKQSQGKNFVVQGDAFSIAIAAQIFFEYRVNVKPPVELVGPASRAEACQ